MPTTNYESIILNRVSTRAVVVAAGTPHERTEMSGIHAHIRNSWPDQMHVARIDLPPQTAGHYFDIGRKVGDAQHRVWTALRSLPADVLGAAGFDKLDAGRIAHKLTYVSYLWESPGNAGTSDVATWDVTAIIEPKVNVYAAEGTVYTPALVVRLSHHLHTMTERVLGNCYREHRCTGCGLTYRVDSSD